MWTTPEIYYNFKRKKVIELLEVQNVNEWLFFLEIQISSSSIFIIQIKKTKYQLFFCIYRCGRYFTFCD